MRREAIGLSLRLARFELVAFASLILGLIAALAVAVAWLDGIRPPAECFAITKVEPPPFCGNQLNAWYSATSATVGLLRGVLIAVTFAAGLFIGAPLVAREIERGTARLAWSLGPSRGRWYATRIAPIALAVGILTFAAGVALDWLAAWSNPGLDVTNAFVEFGSRGALVASRALFVFGVGVAAGAILGRSLPALIVAGVVAFVGLSGGEQVHERMLSGEAVAVAMESTGPGDRFIDQRFRLPDGSLVDYRYFEGREPFDENGQPLYPIVQLVIPGERYRFVEAREGGALAAGTLAALLFAGAAVLRRRPE